jgi:hypothetical protein
MRSAQNQASHGEQTAASTAAGYSNSANQIGSSLIPGLEREANTPEGFTPEEMNNMLVAGEQGAGGTESSVVGQAGLNVARTRNSAGMSNVLDEAARDKMRTNSGNALEVQNESAKLGQEKQMSAQKQLQGLYGTDVSANLEAQGLIPKDVAAEAQAGQSGWFQNMTQLLSSLQGAGAKGVTL